MRREIRVILVEAVREAGNGDVLSITLAEIRYGLAWLPAGGGTRYWPRVV